tara:strand:- start:13038 stop:13940 length:903 start_codon:yes stop_codon:yes gene_type:complete
MTPDEYLSKILEEQTFDTDDQELKDLRTRRDEISKKLRSHFTKSSPSIRWAGSYAKGTMIRESYDIDMTCYFPSDETEAGTTLKAIYESVEAALEDEYRVERKASSLRVFELDSWTNDLHIDVVPGRYTDDKKSDVYLHRTSSEKERLKTNLQTHIDHIKNSGVVDSIRLMKLWKSRNGMASVKTFVLELLVVKLLEKKKSLSISEQLEYVWEEFRDNAEGLSVKDPANSNNDLKPVLDDCRFFLSSAASAALSSVENYGWEEVFGDLDEEEASASGMKSALSAAVASVSTPTKPYRAEE